MKDIKDVKCAAYMCNMFNIGNKFKYLTLSGDSWHITYQHTKLMLYKVEENLTCNVMYIMKYNIIKTLCIYSFN